MNESYTEFDKLLKGFIEESLSLEEQLAFEKILKTDSLARQRYLDYLAVDSMLANHQVEIEDFRKTSKKKVRFDSQRTKQLNRKRKKRSKTPLLLMAACLFLALSLGYYLKLHEKSDGFAVIENFSGDVSVLVKGKTQKAVKGLALQNGFELICAGNSNAKVRTADGSVFTLAPSSQMIIVQNEGQYKIELQGFMSADVNKQPEGKPLLISTSKAALTVLGTVLRVGSSENSTLLTVDEGSVQIKNNQNQKVIVNTDESAFAKDNSAFEVTSLKEYKVNKLEIVSALYGAEDKWVDLTNHIRLRAGNYRLIHCGVFVDLAGDPLLKVVKSLKVEYKIDGKKGAIVINEYKNDLIKDSNRTTELVLPKL